MLVLSRYAGQSIRIPSLNVTITVIRAGSGGKVRLGIEAPPNVRIERAEERTDLQQIKTRGEV